MAHFPVLKQLAHRYILSRISNEESQSLEDTQPGYLSPETSKEISVREFTREVGGVPASRAHHPPHGGDFIAGNLLSLIKGKQRILRYQSVTAVKNYTRMFDFFRFLRETL